MKKCIFLSVIFLLLVVQFTSQVSVQKTLLLQNWTLEVLYGAQQSQYLQSKKFNTTIPTTLHLDLLNHKQIEDPFQSNNHQKQKWISQSNIKYSTAFTLSKDTFQYKNHKLVFEGIDTYSKVRLNGQEIMSTNNSFVKYSADVKKLLKYGENIIQVEIKSPKQFDQNGQITNQMPFEYAHTRKACYQYGWDWAPYLMTLGIWKNVYLYSFNDLQFDYIWARTKLISKQKAIINFAIALDIPAQLENNYFVSIVLAGKVVGISSFINQKHVYVDVQIIEPKLWWPNGIGHPQIYDFLVQIKNEANSTIDSRSIPYGIRSVKLNQQDKKFTIIMNGYPIYAKGANYVPMDMFYPRTTNSYYKPLYNHSQILQDAVDSHFNMIRLWGGGQYQSDQFLEIASRKGIMIFYDFMFSDSIYPSTEQFLINVEEQIKQQIRRARNYPAIALWSGNNQILQGINDWGWSAPAYKENFKKLFETLIPKIIEIQNPQISYISSSPVNGVGNSKFQRGGDFHYWSVWAAGQPFQAYGKAIGPFNSQFGTQALPVWETITSIADQKDRHYTSPILLSHEKHSSKFDTLKSYMIKYMKQSLNFELQTYQSGLLQAYAIEYAIKHQRCSKPISMGTLYWQFNDAWPGVSWSSIDYYGRWKPLQFMAKRLYPDIAIFYTDKNGITLVNDKLYQVQALAIIKLMTFDGQLLLNQSKVVKLEPNSVKKIQINLEKTKGMQNMCFLYTEIVAGRKQVMSSTHFFNHFKDLKLPNAELKIEYHPQYKQITLSSDKFLKNVYISNSKQYLKLTNNYFDLVPGHKVKVQILSETPFEQLMESMVYRSYLQVYQNEQLEIKIVQSYYVQSK